MTRLDSRRRRLLQLGAAAGALGVAGDVRLIPKPVNVADIVWHPSKANAT